MSIVYISHNIDTEGPLAEEHPVGTAGSLSFPHIDVDFSKADINDVVIRHRRRVLGSWHEIKAMLDVATSKEFRFLMPDSFGGWWKYNWFCMDHIGFIDNPRHRAMGIHQIFDYYSRLVERQGMGDALHWHFHPMSTYREANRCATSYVNSPELYYILGRRLLDHRWFPRVNRPGFQDERHDAHWFLEQWIPFDFANSGEDNPDPDMNPDMADGRLSDWRFAPSDWRTYHPHHDCVQREGQCRRKIGRSACLLNRYAPLTEELLTAAFSRAAEGFPTLVGLESHDWRDLSLEVAYARFLLSRVAPRYPSVKFKYAEAVEAFNAVHPAEVSLPVKLSCTLLLDQQGLPSRVNVEVSEGKIFGPQPFLAVRSRSKRIIHDNMNYWRSLNDFNYIFDSDSILPSDVDTIGIATNDAAGNQSIHVIELGAPRACDARQIRF
ncbi:conserved hypothetical protein [Rhodospirillaceae bacterium LM-1]|nr:conserved hypothetical protein [Rhodospirillaceae bacterium LM-1]